MVSSAELAILVSWARQYMEIHPAPDFWVGPPDDHQVERWFIVPRNPVVGVFLHRFLRSDPEHPHDHPYDNSTLVLDGEYLEWINDRPILRRAGDYVTRKATELHRIEIVSGPCISLFITRDRYREWGYWTPRGWISMADYPSEPRYDGRTGELIYGRSLR